MKFLREMTETHPISGLEGPRIRSRRGLSTVFTGRTVIAAVGLSTGRNAFYMSLKKCAERVLSVTAFSLHVPQSLIVSTSNLNTKDLRIFVDRGVRC